MLFHSDPKRADIATEYSVATKSIAPAADGIAPSNSRVLLQYLVLIGELLLLLKVIQVFEIEGRRQLFPLMCLVTGGFIIHHWLSAPFRPRFFLILSFA